MKNQKSIKRVEKINKIINYFIDDYDHILTS